MPIARTHPARDAAAGAPWTIVESTNARYRDLTVARTILAAITARLAEGPPSRAVGGGQSVFGDLDGEATVLSAVDLTQHDWTRPTYRKELARQQAKFYRLAVEARDRGRRARCWPSRAGTRPARAG